MTGSPLTRIWCNGQWLFTPDFPASPGDRGGILGLGLFETLLALDGAPVFAKRHLARFFSSCTRLGWAVPITDLEKIMVELLEMNSLTAGRARVRLAISGGSGGVNDLALGGDHLVWMTATHTLDAPLELSANVSPWKRNEHSPLAGMKCASYAENLVALDHARRLGFQESVFLNTAGHLCETANANLFFVSNGILLTPSLDSGCLPGVTREVLIELAEENGIPCEEGTFTLNDLHAAEEILLTSSIRGAVVVSRFCDRPLAPGPVTRQLQTAMHEKVSHHTGS